MLMVGVHRQGQGLHVTGMLQGAGLFGEWHHSPARDFFARARWNPDDVGLRLLDRLVERLVKSGAVTLSGSPALASMVISERAFVRVTLNVRRHGTPSPARRLGHPGRRSRPDPLPRRVGRRTGTRLNSAGQEAYGRTFARPRPGRYRAVAHVLNGSLMTAGSRAVTLR
jgi:hypothetical protein